MFDDEDIDPEDFKIKVNNDYAKRYEAWREKEELQKCKKRQLSALSGSLKKVDSIDAIAMLSER